MAGWKELLFCSVGFSGNMLMQKWYVVQVMSSHEKKVKKAIEEYLDQKGMRDFITEILIPTENVAEVKRGHQKVSEKRMWPGYLLVKMDMNDEAWAYVKDTPGVIDFLGGEKPAPLTEKEVKDIMAELGRPPKGSCPKAQSGCWRSRQDYRWSLCQFCWHCY